jgi:hypothetical protein
VIANCFVLLDGAPKLKMDNPVTQAAIHGNTSCRLHGSGDLLKKVTVNYLRLAERIFFCGGIFCQS